MKEPIGHKDRDGRDILEGDIVEFHVEYDWDGNPKYDTPSATRMVDTVVIDEGEPYFMDPDNGRAAFAWRHAPHCRVIGNVHDT